MQDFNDRTVNLKVSSSQCVIKIMHLSQELWLLLPIDSHRISNKIIFLHACYLKSPMLRNAVILVRDSCPVDNTLLKINLQKC